MTIEEMNDKIGKATYDAFNKSFEQHFPLSTKAVPWEETAFREQWIAAGCAARNVVLQDVAEFSEKSAPSLRVPCARCGELLMDSYYVSNSGRFVCFSCYAWEPIKTSPLVEPTPSDKP